MSKGPWKRCQTTGIRIALLPDRYKVGGDFDRSQFPDCDLFDLRTIAAAAGLPRVDDFKRRVMTDPTSPIHLWPIYDDFGVLGWATATNSAEQGGRNYRSAASARQLAGKRVTEVSGGSGVVNSQPIETRVTGLEDRGVQVWQLLSRAPALNA